MNGSPPIYEFGPFRLDSGRKLLLHDAEPVTLTPKTLETLLVLIEHRDRVLSKDELLQRIWGETVARQGHLWRWDAAQGLRVVWSGPSRVNGAAPAGRDAVHSGGVDRDREKGRFVARAARCSVPVGHTGTWRCASL